MNNFAGGLIYEFTEEPNHYGLVKILENGDAKLLPDFLQLQKQLALLPDLNYELIAKGVQANSKQIAARLSSQGTASPRCKASYPNLTITPKLPPSPASEQMMREVRSTRGAFVQLSETTLKSPFKVFGIDGKQIFSDSSVVLVARGFGSLSSNNGMYAESDSSYSDYDSSDSDADERLDVTKRRVETKREGNGFVSFFLNVFSKVSRFFKSVVSKFS